jgi:Tfp pilus assembly protein PilO
MKIPKPTKGWHIDVAGVAIAIVVALAAYLMLVRPAELQREQALRLDAEGSAREQRRRELESELYRATQELKELAKLNARENVKVDGETRLNQRIAALSDLAAAAGLSVDVIEPGAGRPGLLYHVTPIQMSGKGRYPQVRAFMSSLYQSMPDLPLTSISLSAAPTAAESTVNFNLEMLWHTAAAPASPKSTQLTNGN